MRARHRLAATCIYTLFLIFHFSSATPVIPPDCRCCPGQPLRNHELNACREVGVTSTCLQLPRSLAHDNADRKLLQRITCEPIMNFRGRPHHAASLPALPSLSTALGDPARYKPAGRVNLGKQQESTERRTRELRLCSWAELIAHLRTIVDLLLAAPEKIVVAGVFSFFVVAAVVQSLREAEARSTGRPSEPAQLDERVEDSEGVDDFESNEEKLTSSSQHAEHRVLTLETIREESRTP